MPTKEPSVLNPTTTGIVPVQDSLRLLAESSSSLPPVEQPTAQHRELNVQQQATAPVAQKSTSLLKHGWWGAVAGTFLLGSLGVHWLQGAACLLLIGTIRAELKSGNRSNTKTNKSAQALANDAVAWGRHLDGFKQK